MVWTQPDGHWNLIANDNVRERVFAELWFGDKNWGEISNEEDTGLLLRIWPNRHGESWEFDYDEAMDALAKAKRRLIGEEP